jgi:fucose permease
MYKKNLVFAAACIGMFLFGIVFLSFGTIFTFLSLKFNIDNITAGSLAALLPLGMLGGSLFFGPFVDRYGYKKLLIICSALIVAGIEAIAYTSSFGFLQAAFFLIGFGGGAINGGTNALVADISSEGKGANLSLLGVFFGVGAISMPALLGALSQSMSYNSIIAGIGLAVIIPIIYFISIAFPSPKQAQGFPIKEGLALLKQPTLILFGFILFFESGLEGIVGNWTTSFMKDGLHLTTENALFALSSQVIALAVARLILGGVLKKVKPSVTLFICYAFIFTGGIIMLLGATFFSSLIALIFIGVGFAAGFPVILGYVGELYANLSGTAFSVVLVMALTGNTLINYLVGAVAQSYGIQKFPIILVICAVIMALLLSVSLSKISTKK